MLPEESLHDAQQQIQNVVAEVQKIVIGQSRLVHNLVIALLAKGHILLEWVPGLAKTLSIETLSKAIWVGFSRIQFTPDLLPSDLLGTRVFDPSESRLRDEEVTYLCKSDPCGWDQPCTGKSPVRLARSDGRTSSDDRWGKVCPWCTVLWSWQRKIRSNKSEPTHFQKRSLIDFAKNHYHLSDARRRNTDHETDE
jgi:hypothetical protein